MAVNGRIKRSNFWCIVANLFTTSRLGAAIYIVFFMPPLAQFLEPFFWLIVYGGASDILDGWAAGFGGRSHWGALYDKGVDKAFCLAALLSLAYFSVAARNSIKSAEIIFALTWAIAFLELMISFAGMIFASIYKTRLEANLWGKAKMWSEVITAGIWALLLYGNALADYDSAVIVCQIICLLFGLGSLSCYLRDFRAAQTRQVGRRLKAAF